MSFEKDDLDSVKDMTETVWSSFSDASVPKVWE